MSETDAAMADEKAGKKSGALSGRQCPDVSSAVKATGSASAARSIRESPEMPSFSANTLSATEEARGFPGIRESGDTARWKISKPRLKADTPGAEAAQDDSVSPAPAACLSHCVSRDSHRPGHGNPLCLTARLSLKSDGAARIRGLTVKKFRHRHCIPQLR